MAKLLYYYPENIPIEEKLNHVGLAEAIYMFWQDFGSSSDNNTQIWQDDVYTHITYRVETNIYIVVGLKRNSYE